MSWAALSLLLCACAAESTGASSHPNEGKPTSSAETETIEPQDTDSRQPMLVPDDQTPVPPDLERLAEMFVVYAVGGSDAFPHGDSISVALGGQPVLAIDDLAAALSKRKIWKICPADWVVYGASSCPVDLLGPINSAVVNDASLVYSTAYGDVVCAPRRTGRLPSGRLVVIRPTDEWRTCATDFALVLAADDQGRLLAVDLTLSEP